MNVPARKLRFQATDQLAIEGVLEGPHDPKAALVLCHPHPHMGGTMNAPLLLAVRDEMIARDWAVLRFNFRGIGESEGRPSTGLDEVEDATGALSLVRTHFPDRPTALAGWSFGAAVAVRVATRDFQLAACCAIAPSVEPKPGITAGLPPPQDVPSSTELMVVCGANDDVVSPAACRRWAQRAFARYAEVPAANHFFWAKYEALSTVVGNFLDGAL